MQQLHVNLIMRQGRVYMDMIHSSFIPPAYPPCTKPLAELLPISIKELQLETHHRGKFLLLRSLTPPSRMTAIMAIMEDETGDAMMLQLYQEEEEVVRAATHVVDIHTILLVKEPYFKVMGDGEYGLRVDHLSDVVRLKRDDAKIPEAWLPRLHANEASAESMKLKGNLAMKESKYWDAIEDYSDALTKPATDSEIEVIKRNRALAFLKTKQFDATLSDTSFPNFSSTPSEKALFRAAEALYNLERFDEACRVLELLSDKFQTNMQARKVFSHVQGRSVEQKTGVYKFKQLQTRAKRLIPPHLDSATYTGPVEIRQTAMKGRGLFVTGPVKAGDLLLCEKAFAYSHVDISKDSSSSSLSLLLNTETDQAFMGGQANLIRIIVQKLYRNPSIAPAFTSLYHGSYEEVGSAVVDETPIVDTFLVERIMSYNVFGCPDSSLDSHLMSNGRESSALSENKEESAHHSCGIWIQASYIYHSCTSNVRRAFIGDMMVVRATKDLEPGTEVCFWYHNPIGASAKSLEKKLSNWGFVCRCTICLDAKATDSTTLRKRQDLITSLKPLFRFISLNRVQTNKVQSLLDSLDRTYSQPAQVVPRLLVWDPQLALTRVYMSKNKMGDAIESAGKVLTSLGFVVTGVDSSRAQFTICSWGLLIDHLTETFLILRAAFVGIGAFEDSIRAGEYARTAYKMVVGEEETFDTTYG